MGRDGRGPVGDIGTEVRIPCVQVRIEVDDRHLADALMHGTQQGQRNGMVTADGDEVRTAFENRSGAGFNLRYGVSDRERHYRQVADVRHLRRPERFDVQLRVVGTKQREAARTAMGPNRAPGRYVTPLSNGIPTIAMSQRST